ncbi:unnamed protein product [Pleuronectes platessa]|uniref:Uncharacterized protein n=1 Tax=Pleuronectes platessa TaxID=8262 RepID=A0A9N7W2M4_PLEPL|nr:unnamed protein product [Pleuronectes platessa]
MKNQQLLGSVKNPDKHSHQFPTESFLFDFAGTRPSLLSHDFSLHKHTSAADHLYLGHLTPQLSCSGGGTCLLQIQMLRPGSIIQHRPPGSRHFLCTPPTSIPTFIKAPMQQSARTLAAGSLASQGRAGLHLGSRK